MFIFTAHLQAQPGFDEALLESLSQSLAKTGEFVDEYDAEVWFKSMHPRLNTSVMSDVEKLDFLRLVHRESKRQGLEPALVLAVIDVESDFDRYAVSRAGAQGLMQIMSFWKDELGRKQDNLIQTETNLRYGTIILRHYLDVADGNLTEALARYNGSFPRTWYAERVFNALDYWR